MVEAAQLRLPAIAETVSFAGDKLANNVRNKNLSASRLPHDPRRHSNGGAEQIALLGDRLARIDAYADTDWMGGRGVSPRERLLHGHCALEGASRRGKGHHEAVPHGFDLFAAVTRESFSRDVLVFTEEAAPGFVTKQLEELCIALHVAVQDRPQRVTLLGRRRD